MPLSWSCGPSSQDTLTAVALLLVGALVLLAGCRKRRAAPRPDHRPAPVTSARTAAVVTRCAALQALPLPAGLHFRHHTFDTCSGPRKCPVPRAAVLLGLARTAARAEERAARAARGHPPLPAGYPLAVHTDELGLADPSLDGVAVVAGLFATGAEARRWIAACGALHPAARVLPLADSRAALTRLPTHMPRRHYVVRISAGPPVPAYAEQDLEQLHPSGSPGHVAPLCTLRPGRLFVFNTRHIRWYRWAPVRCGSRKAYVRWTDSLLTTTVLRRPGGITLLRQVTHVECDQPQVTTWRYDKTGRHALAPSLAP